MKTLWANEDKEGSEEVETALPSVMRAFLSLPATFAFVGFAFSFAFAFGLAFAFDVKSVATTRGGFSGHVPILVQEILLERRKSALFESSVGTPGGTDSPPLLFSSLLFSLLFSPSR